MQNTLLRKFAYAAVAAGVSSFMVSCGSGHKADDHEGHDHASEDTAHAMAHEEHETKDHKPHWSYEGETGPEKWAQLCSEFSDCSGHKQSPIDINGASFEEGLGELAISYDTDCKYDAINNGHTVQVNMDDDNSFEVDGETFKLKQFHFHCPSEHTVDGSAFPMEAHLVHISEAGRIAVIGVLFEEGETNGFLSGIVNLIPTAANTNAQDSTVSFDINTVLPETKEYYRYSGSLTTPPCTEGVIWTVLKTPMSASTEQIKAFASAMPANNARPVQAINERTVTTSAE